MAVDDTAAAAAAALCRGHLFDHTHKANNGAAPKVPQVKKRSVQAIYGNPSHSYGVSLAIWDHTVLPSTRHKRKHPASTPARHAGTRFTDHLRMEG